MFANDVGLAAEVVGLVLVFIPEVDGLNTSSVFVGKGIKDGGINDLPDGVGHIATDEGRFHDIIGAGFCHDDGRPVCALIGDALERFALDTIFVASGDSDGLPFLVRVGEAMILCIVMMMQCSNLLGGGIKLSLKVYELCRRV